MAANPRRRKRILLVVAAVAVLSASAFGVYEIRQSRRDNEATQCGVAGRAALARGDYPAALEGLGRYLARFGNRGATADDYVLYARAMRNVEMPNYKHLLGAIAHLRKALSIDPGHQEARSDLLQLYVDTGYTTEALELLDVMLASSPNDVKLLNTKCALLDGLRRYEPALAIAMRLNELAPADLPGYARTLRLLLSSDAPSTQIDDWLAKTSAAHPNDARFEILGAIAYSRRRDVERAKTSLDHVLAATANATDTPFLKLLIGELDVSGRYPDSMRVLDRVKGSADLDLRREHVRRLWCGGRFNDVIDQMSGWTASEIGGDPEVSALYATALTSVGKSKEAEPISRELSARTDVVSKAWSAFVAWVAGGGKSDRGVETALKDGLDASPTSAVLWQALGDCRAALGEPDMAFEAWTKTTELARSWARPYQKIAEALVARNQAHLAPVYARAAVERAPNDPSVIGTYISTVAADAGELDPKQVSNVLDAMREFQAKAPNLADEMLPSYVGVLARVDKAAAEKRIVEQLDSKAGSSENTLLRLAQVAASVNVSLEERLLELSESLHGMSPRLAMSRALARSRASDDESALATFDEAKRRAAAGDDPVEWELARLSLLERVRRSEACASWIRLADAHPDVLRVQLGAIASDAAWRDREGIARIIERVHGLTGDDGVAWRLARARWVLNAPSASNSDLAEVATSLDRVVRAAPRSTAAHLMLAKVYERLANLGGAEEQLRLASNLAPGSSWIALEIARLAQLQGKPEESLRRLDKLLSAGDLAPEDVEQAAYLLAVQGDMRRGADILAPLTARAQPRKQGLLLLAQLYANLGQYDRAVTLCERLLGEADAKVIELLAGLYSGLDRKADAEAVLARLETADARPGERELVRARHAIRWGTPSDAGKWFWSAVEAAPKSTDAWSALLAYEVAMANAAEISKVLDDPRAADVDSVRFVVSIRPLCMSVLGDERLRSLLVAALNDASSRTVLADAVRIAATGWSEPAKRHAIAQQIRTLADGNTRILALQLVAADLCTEAGDLMDALEITKRSAAQFPDSVVVVRNWSRLLARSGRWDEALAAGLAWRSRSVGVSVDAELLIADALLHLNRPTEAINGLETLAPGAIAHPAGNEPVLLAYAVTLVRCGKAARASEVLSDLARAHPEWRTIPLGVAPGNLGDAASALAWLRTCEGLVPNTPEARMKLARAWGGAWEHPAFHTPELLAGARAVLTSLFSTPVAVEAHVLSATLAFENGEADAARKELAEVLQRDPSQVDAHNNLAYMLAESGQWKEAAEEAKKAILAAPKNPNYRDTLAYALRKGGDYDGARKALEEAILLDPANPAWRLSLAEALAEAGRADDARREIARFDELVAAGASAPGDAKARMDKVRASLR